MFIVLPVTLSLVIATAAPPLPAAGVRRPVVDQAPRAQDPNAAGLPGYYFLLGRYLEGEGKIEEAAAAFGKAIELSPGSAEPRAELAALYARADKPQEAVAAAEQALAVDPKNREANRILGSMYASLAAQKQPLKPGDDVSSYAQRAITALEIARGDGTGDLSIDLALARLYMDRERAADAVPLLRRIVDEQPQYAEGSALLAEAQEDAGSVDAAIQTLTNLLAIQPESFRARVQLAELYDRARKWPEAADAWAAVQKLNARNPEIASRRASSLMNAGRAAEARDVLTGALKIAPGDVRMTFMLAQAQRDSGDLESAETTARALKIAHPEDIRTTYLLAQMLDARGHYEDVVNLLKPEIARLRGGGA